GTVSLRFQVFATDSSRAAKRICSYGLAASRSVSNPQSHAPRPPGIDLPRGENGRSQPADSSIGRNDQTRRRGLFHPGPLLSIIALEISRWHGEALSSAACH